MTGVTIFNTVPSDRIQDLLISFPSQHPPSGMAYLGIPETDVLHGRMTTLITLSVVLELCRLQPCGLAACGSSGREQLTCQCRLLQSHRLQK